MKPNIKKLFQKTLNLKSIYPESKNFPSQNESKVTNLEEFKRQCSNITIFPLETKDNNPENYSKYVGTTLTHISELKDINFAYALEDRTIKEGVPILSFNKDKKILLLDLDETLIHADFDEEYPKEQYDTVIKFKAKKEEDEKKEKNIEDSDSTSCCLSEAEEEDFIQLEFS